VIGKLDDSYMQKYKLCLYIPCFQIKFIFVPSFFLFLQKTYCEIFYSIICNVITKNVDIFASSNCRCIYRV